MLERIQIQLLAAMPWKGTSLGLISLGPEPETWLPRAEIADSFFGFRILRWARAEHRHTGVYPSTDFLQLESRLLYFQGKEIPDTQNILNERMKAANEMQLF